jgi:hypothetical protein
LSSYRAVSLPPERRRETRFTHEIKAVASLGQFESDFYGSASTVFRYVTLCLSPGFRSSLQSASDRIKRLAPEGEIPTQPKVEAEVT